MLEERTALESARRAARVPRAPAAPQPQATICLASCCSSSCSRSWPHGWRPWEPKPDRSRCHERPALTPGHPLGGDSAGLRHPFPADLGLAPDGHAVVLVLVVAVLLGVTTGLLAGFYRGTFEAVAGFVTDVMMSLPGIVLLIALYALTGPNILSPWRSSA